MPKRNERRANEDKVPLSVVFITVGAIFLLTVCAIWVVAPYTVPAPVYAFIEQHIGEPPIFPTLAAVAQLPARPTATPIPADAIVLLPESAPIEGDYPDFFVSAETAVRRQPGAAEPQRILIPRINLDAPVSPISLQTVTDGAETYYQWPVPDEFRAGWHDNSARLGEGSNTVLNGHHNIHGQVFRRLVDLEEGDEIIVEDGVGQVFAYVVIETEIFRERDQPLSVRLENARWINSTADERLTLVTCWPLTDNSHRLVVVARPLNDQQ